jgi:hypothetical protein
MPEKDFGQRLKVSRLKNSALQLAAVSRPVSAETVCTENSDTDVVVMQSAEEGT